MILQALVKYYEDLVSRGEVDEIGWSPVKVSYAICLDEKGNIIDISSVQEEIKQGESVKYVPRNMNVPTPGKITSGILPSFLCNNPSYMFGLNTKSDIDENKQKKNRERAVKCFESCKKYHLMLLDGVTSPEAESVKAFFRKWNPKQIESNAIIQENLDKLLKVPMLVFRYKQTFVHEEESVRNTWNEYYSSKESGSEQICLVTGKKGKIAKLHPSIKGIVGAKSSGASLVSFNADAFCSYNWEQGENAQTSEYAAFAYGVALNHLIDDRKHINYIGDTIVLCWASGASRGYQSAFGAFAFGADSCYSENDLQKMLSELCEGKSIKYEEELLNPGCEFYVLGIAPNAARLSVRFFSKNTFGKIVQNIKAHHERTEIVRPSCDKYETIPMWKLLNETCYKSKPQNIMAGEVLRAVLDNTRYPATLLNAVNLRIRAEHDITRGRAAIIKAFYMKNKNKDVPEEVLTVSLNTESKNVPYTLGRLFAVLENIQSVANPGLNSTITDRYFNSASTVPAVVFPTLISLSQKHLKKVKGGRAVYFAKQLEEMLEVLGEEFPARLNLPQQGAFQLGYYHQKQARYQKNEENEEA